MSVAISSTVAAPRRALAGTGAPHAWWGFRGSRVAIGLVPPGFINGLRSRCLPLHSGDRGISTSFGLAASSLEHVAAISTGGDLGIRAAQRQHHQFRSFLA